MLTNISSLHPTRGEVASWFNTAWNKITEETIKNKCKYVGHFVPGEFGDPSLKPAPNTEYVLVEVQY
jgi:catalase (peroxidase I)